MLKIKSFVFSPFYENTYVLWDDTKDAVVVDPGCYERWEKQELKEFVEKQGLKVVKLLNTHCHIDHVFGNDFVVKTFGVPLYAHKLDLPNLQRAATYGQLFGVHPDPSPDPDHFLEEGDVVEFGNTKLEVLFVPGHAPGHVAFFHRASNKLFSGDVLFRGSIGRVDLPGGNYETLMTSIEEKVLPLGDDVTVYSGHGDVTTVGEERRRNPFIREWMNGD